MRSALPLLVALICAPVSALRSRPAEIVLHEGAGAAQGRLKGGHVRRYAVTVAGRSVAIDLTAQPRRSIAVELYDPGGARVFLQKETTSRWTAAVPKPGVYVIAVVRTMPSMPASEYRLRVEVH